MRGRWECIPSRCRTWSSCGGNCESSKCISDESADLNLIDVAPASCRPCRSCSRTWAARPQLRRKLGLARRPGNWGSQRHTRLRKLLASASEAEVAGPAIGHDPPFAIRLPAQKNEVLTSLFTPFAHGDRYQRLAASSFVTEVAEQFGPQRIQFHFTHPGIEQSEEKFSDRRRAAHHRNVWPLHQGVGKVKVHQIV